MSAPPRVNHTKCGKPSANAGTTRIVREYVKRVASHDLEEYPEWDLKVNDSFSMFIQVLFLIVVQVVQFVFYYAI